MAAAEKVVLVRIEREPTELTGHPRHIHPALDIKYIQAGLEASNGDQVEFIDGWLQRWVPAQFVEEVMRFGADVAVIKAMTPCIDEGIEVGTALRKAGVITIAIGQHVNHAAYRNCPGWEDAFDIPILGDPEEETVRVIERLRDGEAKERVAEEHWAALRRIEPYLVADPNELPQPRFTKEELAAYPFPFPIPGPPPKIWGYLLSGWGCPHRCTHCSGVVRKTYGAKLRVRKAVPLVDEIESLLNVGAEAIIFEDDTLLCDRSNFLEMCGEIERRRLKFPWIAHARPDELDEERVAAAARAGAVLFKIGVESGSARVIDLLGKCRKGGAVWLEHIHEAFRHLHKHNVGAVALFLVGAPGETEEDVEMSIALAKRLWADYIQVQVYCAYPDSPYYIGLDKELSAKVNAGSQYHYATSAWTPSEMPADKLLRHQAVFYRQYYLRLGYMLWHFRRFWRYYANPQVAFRRVASIVGWVAGLRKRSNVG